MEIPVAAAHEVALSMPPGPSGRNSDWRDSRSASTFHSSAPVMQVSELHYSHSDPSPSTFASPTGSSPSASPQHPERRRHSSTFPLFLAQHTSAAPITIAIEPLDAHHNPGGWQPSSSSSENIYSPPPPSRYNLASRTGHIMSSMEFMPSLVSNNTFPAPYEFGLCGHGAAAVGIQRRRLSIPPASQFHAQFPPPPHMYHHTGSLYEMVVHEGERYHEAASADLPRHGRPHFVQEREHHWPQQQQGHPLYPHYETLPQQQRQHSHPSQPPQLLLATPMPTNAPIVIAESPLVYHQYDAPSQTDLSTPVHQGFSNPPSFPPSFMHQSREQLSLTAAAQAYASYAPVPHRTNMDICSDEIIIPANHHQGGSPYTAAQRHTAPTNPAQPHYPMQGDEPMHMPMPVEVVSPTHQQGRMGESANNFGGSIPIQCAVVSPDRASGEQPPAAGAVDVEVAAEARQYYASPIGNHGAADDFQKNALTVSVADRLESDMGIIAPRGTSSHHPPEAVEETKQDSEDGPELLQQQSSGASAQPPVDIKRSPYSSAVDLSDSHNTNMAQPNAAASSDMHDSVAVAPLPNFTALESKEDERSKRSDLDRRVNGDGAVASTGVVYNTGATINTPEAEEAQKPSSQTTIPEAAAATAASGVDPTRSNNINESSSLSLQTTSVLDSAANIADMQAISPSSYSQDSQGYNMPSVYPFTSPYTKTTFNQHLPTVPSLLRPEWRRSSHPDHSTGYQHDGHGPQPPRKNSFDYEDTVHGRPIPPLHRNSLPNLAQAAEHRSPQEIPSAHPSPSQTHGYYTPGERLVPAAFGNPSSSQASASSASSTPPTVLQDASANLAPVYRCDSSAPSSHVPHSGKYDSPRDQKVHYEPAYPAVFNPTAAISPPYGSPCAQEGMFYGSYPPPSEFGRTPSAYPRHFDLHHRRGSSSPAPPTIAGSKRGREDDWGAEETEAGRELQRRRASYSQSTAMIVGGLAYRNSVSVSPSLPSAQMGVIRVAGYVPSLQEMGVRDVTGKPLNAGIERYANGRRPGEGAIRSGSDTSYSFISLPGNTVRKRPRRKFEEITRNYVCIWPGCSKAYGTLNHLNAHVTMQKHGAKRTPSEFKELRKVWRKQKREQQHHQHQHQHHVHGAQNDEGSEFFPDEDREYFAEDDEGSVYNPAVDPTQ